MLIKLQIINIVKIFIPHAEVLEDVSKGGGVGCQLLIMISFLNILKSFDVQARN